VSSNTSTWTVQDLKTDLNWSGTRKTISEMVRSAKGKREGSVRIPLDNVDATSKLAMGRTLTMREKMGLD
jgi:hypothetical protein